MTYVETTMTKDEKLLHAGKVSWWSQWVKIFFVGLFGLPGLMMIFGRESAAFALIYLSVALAFGLSAWLVYVTTELAVTTKRIVAKFGVIRRRTIELRLQRSRRCR